MTRTEATARIPPPSEVNNVNNDNDDNNASSQDVPESSDPTTSHDEEELGTTVSSDNQQEHPSSSSNNNSPWRLKGLHLPHPTLPTLTPPSSTKAPKDTLKAVYHAGKYKASLTLKVLTIQSFMAGIYIASVGQLFLVLGSMGYAILGAALFPGGLLAVVLTSAELFTGDALIFVASVLGSQVRLTSLLRNWCVAWWCNFVGCLAWSYVLSYLSNAIADLDNGVEYSIKVAEKKALNSLGSIFIKGIGANFLVCVGIWSATCAEEVAGKVLALWFPVTAFVLMGFDHVVANMYLIPVGMMLGAKITVGRLFLVLLMATLGNIVGGGIFVGAVYWYVFDSMQSGASIGRSIQRGMTTMRMSLFRGSTVRRLQEPTAIPDGQSDDTSLGIPATNATSHRQRKSRRIRRIFGEEEISRSNSNAI